MSLPLVSKVAAAVPLPLSVMGSDDENVAVARIVGPLPPAFTAAGPVPSFTMPPLPTFSWPPLTVKVPLPPPPPRALTTTRVAVASPPV